MSNFIRTRGDTWTLNFTLNAAADGTTWIIPQFTTIQFTIRTAVPATSIVSDEDAVLHVSYDVDTDMSDGGGSISVTDDTHFVVTVDAETTQDLDAGSFYYDVQVTRTMISPAQAYTTARGRFQIQSDITRTPATPAAP